MALGKPIVPVSTLEALARSVAAGHRIARRAVGRRAARRSLRRALRGGRRSPDREPTALPPGETLTAVAAIAAGRRRPLRRRRRGPLRGRASPPRSARRPRSSAVAPRLAGAIGLIAAAAPTRRRAARGRAALRPPAGRGARARPPRAGAPEPGVGALMRRPVRTCDPMIIDRLTGDADLDAVVALEAASFTNPWSREMLARELEQPTSARVYVLRLPGRRSRPSVRAGSSPTSCTSTPSPSTPTRRRQGLGRALMDARARRCRARGRPPRHARGPALERRRPAALRAAGIRGRRLCGNGTTPSPRRMR